MTENEIAKILVNIFLKVHRTLGPGLLESVYEAAICYELDKLGLLVNFNVDLIKYGIKRIVNNL